MGLYCIAVTLWDHLQRHKQSLKEYEKCLKIDPNESHAKKSYPEHRKEYDQKQQSVRLQQTIFSKSRNFKFS